MIPLCVYNNSILIITITQMKKKKISPKDFIFGSSGWKYARMLEESRGHSYQYYTDSLEEELEKKGYQFWNFNYNNPDKEAKTETMSETLAKEVVTNLRSQGYLARIIAGREKNLQRIKMFSVCFKKKEIGKSNPRGLLKNVV